LQYRSGLSFDVLPGSTLPELDGSAAPRDSPPVFEKMAKED
jgi:hypothetical protein